MTARSWIRRLFSPTTRSSRKPRARVRPAVVRLEDRLAPANYMVSTLADDGSAGSLRSLIADANADSALFHQASTITIPSSIYVSGFNFQTGEPQATIRLNGTQLPTILGRLTIVGDQTPTGGLVPVWYISGEHTSRVLQVGPNGNLTLDNLTINNGATTDTAGGGGISNQGSLTLENVTVSANSAPIGGGIDSTGPSMLIEHSTITGNHASVSGGGVWTYGANATFNHDTISNNGVTGVDHSTNSPSASPSAGGLAEGGGLDISGGNVSITFSTINGNAVQAGAGGRGSVGTSYDPSRRPRPSGVVYDIPATGGTGITGGLGGQAQGGGIAVDGGSLSIANSTLSHNTALGGVGGTGGAGGTGQGGQDGEDSNGTAPGVTASGGGAGGQGGTGGAGGPGHGGGLFVARAVTGLTMTDSTVADNQATGGQGGQSGVGGNGGDGANGGAGFFEDGLLQPAGSGGVGGAGGNGGTTGAPGPADGAGIYFDPSSNTRQLASSTIAFNNVAHGADAQPIIIFNSRGNITLSASPGGKGGLGGYPGLPNAQVRASSGADGLTGILGTPQAVYGGGLCEDDSIMGVGFFKLSLTNSIVAANTANTSSANDIAGTLANVSSDVANLVGSAPAVGLVDGQQENHVGVTNPGLLPLGNYGGETQTIAPLANSPAHGAGDGTINSLTIDQRGFSRVDGNNKLDIGAFELQRSFVVTTLQDRNDGSTDPGFTNGVSLRDVVTVANASSTPQTITFAPGLTGTITLTQGHLPITSSMTIAGPGANLLSISGNNVHTVFEIHSGTVTISGLSIINGYAGNLAGGGGIYNQGNLTLEGVVVSNNTATGPGGGIYTAGPLSVMDSTISNNNASGAGGGITNVDALINVVNSTISDNTAGLDGGGIYSHGYGYQTGGAPLVIDDLTNVTIAANTSPGGKGVSAVRAVGLNLTNSIIGDGLELEAENGVSGVYDFYGGNLIAGSNIAGVIAADPKLGPLQNNGGPTPTMALLPGSPAIDAGVNSYALDAQGNPVTSDQKGFPRISGAKVDLGAYEVQQASLGTAPRNGQVGTPYSQTMTATQAGSQVSWGTFAFAVTDGTPPTGLSLSPAGVLSGTPTAAGTFTFTVFASNLAGFGSQQYSVTINPLPAPVVDTLADTFDYDYSAGHLSLREALYIAQLPGVTTPVAFAPGLHGAIALTGGQLTITKGVTIQGPGTDVITINGGGQSSVFHIAGADPAHFITTNISGLTVTNANNGPGIYNTNDTLSLSDVVVTGNSGDGIDNDQGVLHVVDSSILSNQSSGIADVDGKVTLVGSTVADNFGGDQNGNGGGISVIGTGGLMEATLSAVNSTIADNAAYYLGGGIYASGAINGFGYVPVQVTLNDVTVAGNYGSDGAGIYNSGGSTLTIHNTIVGANVGAPDLTNDETIGALTVARGGNLVESVETVINGVSVPVGSEFDASPPVISADPKLGPLHDNGGPTPTMALLPGSPAIDKGDSTIAGLPDMDQRGYVRIVGPAVDLGAYEYGSVAATADLSVSGAASSSVAPGGQATFTLTVTNNSSTSQNNVTLADDLPANTTLVSWAAPSGWSSSAPTVGTSGTVKAWIASLAANTSATFTLVVQVDSNTAPGTVINNTASVSPLTSDPNPNNNSVSFTVSVTAPATVLGVQVNDGTAQRSMVMDAAVVFSTIVGLPADPAAAFRLTRVSDGAAVSFTATASVVFGVTAVKLSNFTGPATQNGSLADGRYTLTVLASQVTAFGTTLDGNGDGTAGDDYVSAPDTYQGNGPHLYRLFGDVSGDGVVDATDLGQFRSAFNTNNTQAAYLWYLDADGSGAIDSIDLGQFRSRFNHNVFV